MDAFLVRAGWEGAVRRPLAGDASFRRYERVRGAAGQNAVLMDAPPDKEDIAPFATVAEFLTAQGHSAPRVLARDAEHGFLLLEDLGDDLFSRLLAKLPDAKREAQEEMLYVAATDVLIDLNKQWAKAKKTIALPPYDEALLLREVSLFSDWYLPAILGEEKAADLRDAYLSIWKRTLAGLPDCGEVIVLRDFHADNLLWLPTREGFQRVGLLDFQDAVAGSPAYDMVSFLEDARRDVCADTVARCQNHFVKHTGVNADDFAKAYALLGAQRNCKIVGIFTRLGKRDGKLHYQSYLSRVWRHLRRDFQHPALAELKTWMDAHVSEQWQTGKAPLGDFA